MISLLVFVSPFVYRESSTTSSEINIDSLTYVRSHASRDSMYICELTLQFNYVYSVGENPASEQYRPHNLIRNNQIRNAVLQCDREGKPTEK
jgi:hypothetical protein